MQFTIFSVLLAAASFSPIIGAKALQATQATTQQGKASKASPLFKYINDPSFEVLGSLGCGGSLGLPVGKSDDMHVYMSIDGLERELEYEPGEPPIAEYKPDPTLIVNKYNTVENVIHWTVRVNPHVEGKGVADWKEDRVDIKVPYKLRDLVRVGEGEMLILGESVKGATIIESWVLGAPVGPGPWSGKDLWIPVDRFTSGVLLSESFDVEISNRLATADPGPIAFKKVVNEKTHPGQPVAFSAYLPKGLIFLLTRDEKTKATTLRKLETRNGWAESIIKTSAELPLLSSSVEVEVLPVGNSTGYLLAVWGLGFGRMVNDKPENKYVREALCLEDLNGDGVFETEQTFKDWHALYEYHRTFETSR